MKNANFYQLLEQQNRHWQPNYQASFGNLRRDLFRPLLTSLLKNRLIKVVEGPRRVGKSYLIWQVMETLLSKHKIKPFNLVYFQFQSLHNQPNFINQLIDTFRKNLSPSNQPLYFFLDEIQLIDYWQDQIKQYYDLYPQMHFLVTGSTSLFKRQRSKESLLGRVEKFKLGSLSFLEYLRFKGSTNLPPSLDLSRKITVKREAFLQFQSLLPLFRSRFKAYLFSGQYPELAITPKEKINPKFYLENIVDLLVNTDIPYIFPKIDRPLFLNVLKAVSFNLADEFSFSNIARDFKTNRKIVAEYIYILEEINLFAACLNSYFSKMRKKLAASKKIYSLNASLALAVNGFDKSYLNDSRVFGHYVENYVFARLKEYDLSVEYYRDRNLEIDFVTKNGLFEVKSGKKKSKISLPKIKKLRKPLFFLTESEYSQEKDCLSLPWYLL